jgi:uncharacterized YigZ family protein
MRWTGAVTSPGGSSSYLVVARTADVELEARRSRFRCRVERVADEEAAREVVESARRRHWDAGHHCSAFVLGADGATARSSDDGEPAGSAGAPMLETLRGREVSDVVAVVSRWFGGTLLGVGGLVRAYSDAVALALDEAGTLRRERRDVVEVDAGHAEAGRLEHELRSRGLVVRDAAYGAVVTFTLAVPARLRESLPGTLAELTGGRAAPRRGGTDWVDLPPG